MVPIGKSIFDTIFVSFQKVNMAKKSRRMFDPILPKAKEWPVVRLSKHRGEFIEEVITDSFNKITNLYTSKVALREEIETTMYRERLRIKAMPWKVDPADEKSFWEGVKKRLLTSAAEKGQKIEKEILNSIISRYTNEIAGNFKPSRYRFARSIATAGFRRLLNASKIKTITGAITGKHTLLDKIKITGELELIRTLAANGTIVMVPTHFSNLDSILIGWVIYMLGLPPFIYGAGLNLFNIGIFAYFMNSLGAYKVDRRKKNLIYLETLKTYSTLSIQKGCHSLFFPGGTRSRSGKIESELKLGLLGTAIEAQRKAYQEATGKNGEAKKVYIVPVTLNYNFVLEAPVMIKHYLERKGQERFYFEMDEYSTSYKILTFLFKFFTKDAQISVSVGRPLNLVGNYVNADGNSYDQHGNLINTREYFMTQGKVTENPQREQEYTRILSKVITREFHIINKVMASHMVAFVGFCLFRKEFPKLDLYSFFRLPEEDLSLEYNEFLGAFSIVKKEVLRLNKEGKVGIDDHMNESDEEIIQRGLKNVGMYHVVRPITRNKEGKIITQDLTTLYYYHNRMDGYDLEKLIS